jgi:hypothetical protein
MLPANRRQQSRVLKSTALIQADRGLVGRIANHRHHQAESHKLATLDQRRQPRAADASAWQSGATYTESSTVKR